MVPTDSVSQSSASRESIEEGKDKLISSELLRKGAERFGWSASVWLSKHLNGRQPALITKTISPAPGLVRRSNAQQASNRSKCQL